MKKERILYLDVIKFFAVICVFVCHFARTLEYYQISYDFKILPDNIFSVYTGTVGCVLFFIVSGATLMYVYQEKLNLRSYFFKRFKGIYPMFWITFIIFFCLQFYIDGGYNKSIPVGRFFFTFIGFDGLVEYFCVTFFTVGAWFLGMLIIMYILFPVLRKLVNEFPYAILTVSILIGMIIDYTYDNSRAPVLTVFAVWIPAFTFGMVFLKYIKSVNKYMLIVSMTVLMIFTIFDLNIIYFMTRVYFVGAALFFILAYIFIDAGGGVFTGDKFFCRQILLSHFSGSSPYNDYFDEKVYRR